MSRLRLMYTPLNKRLEERRISFLSQKHSSTQSVNSIIEDVIEMIIMDQELIIQKFYSPKL